VCRQKGIRYICDPGQSLTQWEGEALKKWIDGSMILITNDYELEIIMKMTGTGRNELLGLTKTIITTLGEKGSLISTSQGDVSVPPAKVANVLDPTGAGDAFRAGLLKGMILDGNLEKSAKMGAITAAYAIEQYGTQEHYFTYEDFLARYKSNFGEM
jgi:adenosine kinase